MAELRQQQMGAVAGKGFVSRRVVGFIRFGAGMCMTL